MGIIDAFVDLCGRIDQLAAEHPEITTDRLILDDIKDCACADTLLPLDSETALFTQIEAYAQILF